MIPSHLAHGGPGTGFPDRSTDRGTDGLPCPSHKDLRYQGATCVLLALILGAITTSSRYAILIKLNAPARLGLFISTWSVVMAINRPIAQLGVYHQLRCDVIASCGVTRSNPLYV